MPRPAPVRLCVPSPYDTYSSPLASRNASAEMIDWVARISLEVPLVVAQAAFASVVAHDARPALAAVAVPTLVTVGAHDHPAATGGAAFMAERVAGARLVTFDHSGHFPQLEEAALYTATLVEFIAG